MQFVVDSVLCNKLRVSSLFRHDTFVNDNDIISILDSRQAMSDNQACATNLSSVESFLHHLHSNTQNTPKIQVAKQKQLDTEVPYSPAVLR